MRNPRPLSRNRFSPSIRFRTLLCFKLQNPVEYVRAARLVKGLLFSKHGWDLRLRHPKKPFTISVHVFLVALLFILFKCYPTSPKRLAMLDSLKAKQTNHVPCFLSLSRIKERYQEGDRARDVDRVVKLRKLILTMLGSMVGRSTDPLLKVG